MDEYLCRIAKILIIRMENKKPIEGYDTSLLHAWNRRVVEIEEPPVKLSSEVELGWTSHGNLRLVLSRLFKQAPNRIEYNVLTRVLSLIWGDKRLPLPLPQETVPEDPGERAVKLLRERRALWKQLADLRLWPDRCMKGKHDRIIEINHEIGEDKSDSTSDFHEAMICETHIRIGWSHAELSCDGEEHTKFDVITPISLSFHEDEVSAMHR